MITATPQWSLLGETVGKVVLAESSKTETATFFLFFKIKPSIFSSSPSILKAF